MIQNGFALFDRNLCLTLKLSTACSTLNESVVKSIIKLDRNERNEINTHTEDFKNTTIFPLIEKELFSPERRRKKTNRVP